MNKNEVYQYKILDRVYFANYEELEQKIQNGNVLRLDLVKVGKNAWTEAEKIPIFSTIFEETEQKLRISEGIDFANIFTNFQVKECKQQIVFEDEVPNGKVCAIHPGKKPHFICTVCENLFCKDCPANDENGQKICLYCGGTCDLYDKRLWQIHTVKNANQYEIEEAIKKPHSQNRQEVYTKLKFKDFINALIQPFSFPLSFLTAGILFSVLVFGLIVTVFRSGWMLLLTLPIITIILILQFGVLSKSFENCSQFNRKKWKCNIPHLTRFAVWEEFVTPFWSGLSAGLLSFSLFIVLGTIAAIFAWFSFSNSLENIKTEMIRKNNQVNSVLKPGNLDSSEAKKLNEDFNKMLDKMRFKQMESVFGKNHLADNDELQKLVKSVMRLTIWLQMPICFAFILGILFFPAVCLSVGERRSLKIKKRFVSSIKMMRTIGFDYMKILFLCIVLTICSLFSTYFLGVMMKNLQLPTVDVITSILASSFLIFYFWLVFSNILGITILHKESIVVEGS